MLFTYRALFGVEPSFWFMFVVLILWGIGWHFTARHLSKLLCPSCGRPAIPGPYFFMRHAQCQHCGLSYAGA